MRVVSLLPSATELLCAVGAEKFLVGRSHECDWPPSITDRPILTGQKTSNSASSAEIDAQVRELAASDASSLYTLDVEQLKDLAPDLIITQDLCDVCSIDLNTVRRVAADMDPQPEILSLNPQTLFDVFDDVLSVGTAVGRERAGRQAMVAMREGYWSAVDYVNPYVPGPEILFLEWMDPPFVGGHWTPGLIEAAGGTHRLNVAGNKSRQVTPEEIIDAQPQRVIICPCGLNIERIKAELPNLQSTTWWNQIPAVNNPTPDSVMLVDGNAMFNRPGPRLVDAYRWLVAWLNDRPEVLPPDFPCQPMMRD